MSAGEAANVATLRTALAGITALDASAVTACLHPDLLFQLPYESRVPDLDRAGFTSLLQMMFERYRQFTIAITHVYELTDPGTLIARYEGDCIGVDGVPYANNYIGVFEFTDGLISLWREYDNPAISAAAQEAHTAAAAAPSP